jgi:hypothetical protein
VIVEVVEELDTWVVARNLEARAEGTLAIAACEIRLLGQSALWEQKAPLAPANTNDIDVRANYTHAVEQEFGRLLAQHGKVLDPLGREIWMPRETRYTVLFEGEFVTLRVADVEAVLLSEALKAPAKNRALLTEYLASGASPRFLEMVKKYGVELEQFL